MVTFTYEVYYHFTRKPYSRQRYHYLICNDTFLKAKAQEQKLIEGRLRKYKLKRVLPEQPKIGLYELLSANRSLHYNLDTKFIRTYRGCVIADSYGETYQLLHINYDPYIEHT